MIHSFLMIGQSNMAGRGAFGDVPPIDNPSLKVLRNGRWQPFFTPVNPDRPFSGISMAESFADAYQRDHGVCVGLIPCADGGTQLEQWKEGSLLFDHAVLQARLAERTSTIAGVLWHQGESDCKPGLCETYLERLNRFYDALTAALDGYDLARADFRELAAYYEGADWRQDFEDDEAGLLPSPDELPRGVLSEDGIYDLLELERDLLSRMAECAGERMEELV